MAHQCSLPNGCRWMGERGESPATPSSVLCFLALKCGPLDSCGCTNENVCSSHCPFTICSGILQSGLTLLKTPEAGVGRAAARRRTTQHLTKSRLRRPSRLLPPLPASLLLAQPSADFCYRLWRAARPPS